MEFQVSEVRFSDKDDYLVITRLSDGRVSAVFEVSLGARRKRHGWHRELKHHKKTFEMLEDQAKQSVTRFCESVSDFLKRA